MELHSLSELHTHLPKFSLPCDSVFKFIHILLTTDTPASSDIPNQLEFIYGAENIDHHLEILQNFALKLDSLNLTLTTNGKPLPLNSKSQSGKKFPYINFQFLSQYPGGENWTTHQRTGTFVFGGLPQNSGRQISNTFPNYCKKNIITSHQNFTLLRTNFCDFSQ